MLRRQLMRQMGWQTGMRRTAASAAMAQARWLLLLLAPSGMRPLHSWPLREPQLRGRQLRAMARRTQAAQPVWPMQRLPQALGPMQQRQLVRSQQQPVMRSRARRTRWQWTQLASSRQLAERSRSSLLTRRQPPRLPRPASRRREDSGSRGSRTKWRSQCRSERSSGREHEPSTATFVSSEHNSKLEPRQQCVNPITTDILVIYSTDS